MDGDNELLITKPTKQDTAMEIVTPVSVISAVRNRTARLQANLPTWLDDPGIDEIVVVDWGSDELIKVEWPRTRIVRVEAKEWNWEMALNLAAQVARGDVLLQLDVDYRICRDFVATHVPYINNGKSFAAGYSGDARSENERHLAGLLMVDRRDFEAVGGYNEGLRGYGYGDQDIVKRLRSMRLTRYGVDLDRVSHVPHGDEMRLNGETSCKESIKANYRRARRQPWHAGCIKWCEVNIRLVSVEQLS